MINGHGGNIYALAKELGCHPQEILDLSSNINPLGIMPQVELHLKKSIKNISALPEVDNWALMLAFADTYEVPPQTILAGAGTTQLIHTLPLALKIRRALILGPTYADYADACRLYAQETNFIIAKPDHGFVPNLNLLDEMASKFDTVFICNPNNPTGVLIDKNDIHSICLRHPSTRFIVDESYLPFLPNYSNQCLIGINQPNIIVLYSLSKIFGIPGLRIGFAQGDESTLAALTPYYLPWSINSLAQAAGIYLMTHKAEVIEFMQATWDYLDKERSELIQSLQRIRELQCFPSTTSFVLIRLPYNIKAQTICRSFAEHRILIRNCSNFIGLDEHYVRISLKSPEANRKAVNIMTSLCDL